MNIELTMEDFKKLRLHLFKEIDFAKKYIKRHEYKAQDKSDGYNIEEDKIAILEPILNKINEQLENQKVIFKISQ